MDKHIETLERMENAIHTLLLIGDRPLETAPEDVQAEVEALRAAIALMRGQSWQDIATAPKGENTVLSPSVLLGYAPDETGYSPRTVEGYWNHEDGRWNWSHDPNFNCPQPTHWQPLPAPPKDTADEQ